MIDAPYPNRPEGGDDPDEIDELDAALDATDDVLTGSLAQILSAPADLEDRTRQRVTTSLMSRSVLGTSADLLAVGWETMRLLWTEPHHDEEEAP